jgi:hypothetical protein
VAHVVECWPCKCEAQSSNPSTAKKEKKENPTKKIVTFFTKMKFKNENKK